MILKLGMKHEGEELYKVYINRDLGMTLTYFIYPSSQVSVYRTIGPLVLFVISLFFVTKTTITNLTLQSIQILEDLVQQELVLYGPNVDWVKNIHGKC